MSKTFRNLKVELTHDEKYDMGLKLAKEHGEIVKATEAKEEVSATLTAELKAARARASSTARVLANGYEFREVECEWRYTPEERRADLVRLDLGEVVETRPMTEKELQKKLDLPEPIPAQPYEAPPDVQAGPWEPVPGPPNPADI